jgi:carboxyl-terminal processing protease
MKKKKDAYYRLIELVIVVMVSTMIGMFSGGASVFTMIEIKNSECKECKADKSINNDLSEVSDIYEQLIDNYYKDVDKEALIEGAINGMLSTLEDPNSSYMDSDTKNSFDERMTGEYKGVGLEILPDDEGNIVVVSTFDDSPAKKSGLKPGDIVNKVNGVEVKGKKADEVATSIKTSEGDTVKLDVTRDKSNFSVTLTKQVVTIKSVTSKTFTKNNKKIGYLKISIFANNTYSQFKQSLESLEKQNISSLIIDVRNNTGGYLSSVSSMLELFLDKGNILYQLQTKDKTTSKKDETSEKRAYPIVMLVNGYSASASEILTTGLNENRGSSIVGVKTYGKGTVQQTIDVEGGGMAKITTQKWLTPKGNWIHEKGIEPTKNIVLNENYVYNPIDANDNQLQEALNEAAK